MRTGESDAIDANATLAREHFEALATAACEETLGVDRVLLKVNAEASQFVRFNQARVRQATHVRQTMATLSVVAGTRRASSTMSLPDTTAEAIALLRTERAQLIDMLAMVPNDPHLRLPETVANTDRDDLALSAADRHTDSSPLPETGDIIDQLLQASHGMDLVGFLANGPSLRAFADSRGQRNWHRVASFNLDWSCYAGGEARDRAVKTAYAGTSFSPAALADRMALAREQLARLRQPATTLDPGEYRVLLAPAAVTELLQAMAWSGFSERDRRSGTSSLVRLQNDACGLDKRITLIEAPGAGIAPTFTETGHIRPASVALIESGRGANTLVSPRSAAEYGLSSNADASEYPDSLQLALGTLALQDALAALDNGLMIGNLWYLNYSDRPHGRVTGMTRFACFTVKDGKIAAPVNVMRFDASLFDIFGKSLEALGDSVDFIPGSSTWGARELSSVSCPAVLLNALSFTL